MRGVYNQPWLDLDDLVPLSLLNEEHINIELATSTRTNNTYGADRPNDFAQHLRPPPDASEMVQAMLYASRVGASALTGNLRSSSEKN